MRFPIVDLGDLTDQTKTEIILLRTKLEIRTWFLRASLAVNIALLTGFVIREVIK